MIKYRIMEKPSFDVIGRKTWISSQDNEFFGRFWAQCQAEGLFETFEQLNHNQVGKQTKSSVLGVSCVEKDPGNRAFYYLIGIEKPEMISDVELNAHGVETYHVDGAKWAVFECIGKVPEAIVKSEMYAFMEWLPASEFEHAKAPELEVYFPGNDGNSANNYCEFWLPIVKKAG